MSKPGKTFLTIGRLLPLLMLWGGTGVGRAGLIQHLESSDPSNVVVNASNEVTSWNDLSGNLHHAVPKTGISTYPATPLFPTGKAGLSFGPLRTGFALLNVADTDALLDFSGDASGNSGFAVMVALQVVTQKTDDWNDVVGVTSAFTDGGFSLRYSQGGVIQVNLGGVSYKRPLTDVEVASGDSLVMIVNYHAETGKLELWDSLNQSIISWTQPAGDFSMGGDGTLRLGEMGNTGRFFIGSVGEVKVFNSWLSLAEMSQAVADATRTWIDAPGPAAFQHLDASVSASVIGSPITLWQDQSGNARNATNAVGSSTYPGTKFFSSGRVGVNFGDLRNTLEVMSVATAENVLDFAGAASGNSGFSLLLSVRVDQLRDNDWNDLIGTATDGTVGGFGLRYSKTGVLQAYMGGTPVSRPATDKSVKTGTSLVMGLNYDAGSGVATLWDSLNGTEITWTIPAGDFVDDALTLGGTVWANRYFDGSVGEVKVYDQKLTPTQFEEQRSAMTLKWVGIKPQMPVIPKKPAWTIDQLLNWDPAADPDAPFNVGKVPLQDRIDVPAALKANSNAKSGQGGIQALETFSGSLPQGGPGGENLFTFTYWQYLEESVYWGGIGNINFVPPTGEMIDNAHRNGVPILGTVFFPPLVYGGNYAWVQTFLQKDGDTFPAADKLIETAEYYGFDGWFINQETEGGTTADAAAMRDLIRYIRENSTITIRWYDSMREDGVVSWQDQLNSENDWYLRHNYTLDTQNDWGKLIAHGMFVDFIDQFYPSNPTPTGYTEASRARALQLGLDPYQIFTGQEAEANNFKTSTSWRLRMSTVFPDGQDHITSIGFYKTHKYAEEIADQDLFWTGAAGDPRDTSSTVQTGIWKGVAHNIAARSVIDTLPFATDFNLGKGDKYYIKGKMVSETPWYNRAQQALLPTWRWIVDSTATQLTPELWSGDSYQGGSCLRVSGALDGTNTIRLYLTQLTVTANTRLLIVYKRSGHAGVDSFMEAGLSFSTAPAVPVYFDAGNCDVDGWNETIIDLGGYAGSVIRTLNLKFNSPTPIADYEIRVGKISIYDASAPLPEAPANIQEIDLANWAGFSTGRIKWDPPAGDSYSYNVYMRLIDGSLVFVGNTPNSYYAFEEVALPNDFRNLVVQTVAPDMRTSLLSDEEFPEIQVTPMSGAVIQLSWSTVTDAVLESRSDLLKLPDWQEVTGGTVMELNGTSSVELPTDPNEQRFFRLRW